MEVPDLIFVDGHIGPMTAKDALCILNKLINRKRATIIIHTGGYVTEEQKEEYYKLGADKIMNKGTLFEEIKNNFRYVIKSFPIS